jgi:hypothetical protein
VREAKAYESGRRGWWRGWRTPVTPSGVFARGGEDGLSLLELVVAMSVFALSVLAISATIDSGLTLTRNNRQRSVAANLGSQEMDTVRSSTFTSLTARTVTQVVDGSTYTTDRELTWVSKSATNGPCDGSNASPALLRVRVTVSWSNMRGVKPIVTDTLLAPPVGAYSTNSGHIAVKVLDASGAGEDGTSVQISGPSVQTLPTNSDGCAFFAFLAAGTYTVSLNTPGYVDRQSATVPTQTVGVTVGNVSSVQFDYDQAATLALTFTASAGGTIPNNISVTLGNTSFVPSGAKRFAGTGLTRTLTNLFPSSGGYTTWAGTCADADPEGQNPNSGGAFWPGAQRPDALNADPGVTTAGTVAVKSVGITVFKFTGHVAQAGVTVVATHAADQTCGSGASYTLGTTDATGALNSALPYGTWTITVTGKTPKPSWPLVVLDPRSATTPSVEADVN